MLNQKVLSSENPKCEDVGGRKTEKQGYKDVHRTIIKKLGDCKETKSEGGRFSVLIVGIHIGSAVKAAKVLVCSEWMSEISFELTPG